MFVAVRHHPVGTLKSVNDGRIQARLGHSRQHRALVFFVDQGHRLVLIGIKKNRVIWAGIAAKLLAKLLELALNELLSFCAQVNMLILRSTILLHGSAKRRRSVLSRCAGYHNHRVQTGPPMSLAPGISQRRITRTGRNGMRWISRRRRGKRPALPSETKGWLLRSGANLALCESFFGLAFEPKLASSAASRPASGSRNDA